jgi:hypothetical protein
LEFFLETRFGRLGFTREKMSVATCDSMMGAGLYAFENARRHAPALIAAALIVRVSAPLAESAACPAMRHKCP